MMYLVVCLVFFFFISSWTKVSRSWHCWHLGPDHPPLWTTVLRLVGLVRQQPWPLCPLDDSRISSPTQLWHHECLQTLPGTLGDKMAPGWEGLARILICLASCHLLQRLQWAFSAHSSDESWTDASHPMDACHAPFPDCPPAPLSGGLLFTLRGLRRRRVRGQWPSRDWAEEASTCSVSPWEGHPWRTPASYALQECGPTSRAGSSHFFKWSQGNGFYTKSPGISNVGNGFTFLENTSRAKPNIRLA